MKSSSSNPFARSLLTAAVAAGLALSAGGAIGQTGDHPSSKASTETKRGEKDARKAWEQTHRASKIIGSEVRNAQDQKVGKVKDLVLGDPSSGTISHVVVSVGGVAGMGDKLFAVPFSEIHQAQGKDYLVLSASSDLSKGFDDKNWPTDTAWHNGSGAGRTSSASAPAAAPSPASTPAPSSASPATPGTTATTSGAPSGTSPSSAETPSPGTTQ
jgi:sporulation protein YlmC with PRC-barrel domain